MNHQKIATIDTSGDEDDHGTAGTTVTAAGLTHLALVGLTHWQTDDTDPEHVMAENYLFTPGQARELAQALLDAAYAVDNKTVTLSTYEPTTGDLATLALAFDAAEKAGLGVCVGNGFQAHEGKHDQAAVFIETWLFGREADAA